MTRVTVTRRGVDVLRVGGGTPGVSVVGGGGRVTVRGVGTQGVPGPVSPKGMSLEWPVNGEDVTLWYAPWEVTLASLHAVLRASPGESVHMRVVHGASRQTVDAVVADAVVSDRDGGVELIDGPVTVPMGHYVWLEILAVTGQVRELHLTEWF